MPIWRSGRASPAAAETPRSRTCQTLDLSSFWAIGGSRIGGQMANADNTGAVPMAETWPEYVRRISGGATQAQIAEQIGVGRLSVCNWLHGKTRPKAETVIIVARAYRRSPIEALIAASYLDSSEADNPIEIRASLADAHSGDLGAEVLRRLTRLDNLTAPSN